MLLSHVERPETIDRRLGSTVSEYKRLLDTDLTEDTLAALVRIRELQDQLLDKRLAATKLVAAAP